MHHARTLLTVAIALVAFVAAIPDEPTPPSSSATRANDGASSCPWARPAEATTTASHSASPPGPRRTPSSSIEVDVCLVQHPALRQRPARRREHRHAQISGRTTPRRNRAGESASTRSRAASTPPTVRRIPGASGQRARGELRPYWVVLNVGGRPLPRQGCRDRSRRDRDGAAGWQLHNGRCWTDLMTPGRWVNRAATRYGHRHPRRRRRRGRRHRCAACRLRRSTTHRRPVITAAESQAAERLHRAACSTGSNGVRPAAGGSLADWFWTLPAASSSLGPRGLWTAEVRPEPRLVFRVVLQHSWGVVPRALIH